VVYISYCIFLRPTFHWSVDCVLVLLNLLLHFLCAASENAVLCMYWPAHCDQERRASDQLKASSQHINLTELNGTPGCELQRDQAPWNTRVQNWSSTKRPSFAAASNQYAVWAWRWRAWPMNASCNWVDFFKSVQFMSRQHRTRLASFVDHPGPKARWRRAVRVMKWWMMRVVSR